MNAKNLLLFLFIFSLCVFCQSSKKQSKNPLSKPSEDNFLMSIVNTILGGPHDAPILTRLMNKVSHIATVLLGSVFAYFKWFRQRKQRREKINEFIGEEKHKFAIDADA
jgi:preprotein translocase subunit YajC